MRKSGSNVVSNSWREEVAAVVPASQQVSKII
jgi:hypothetical protein